MFLDYCVEIGFKVSGILALWKMSKVFGFKREATGKVPKNVHSIIWPAGPSLGAKKKKRLKMTGCQNGNGPQIHTVIIWLVERFMLFWIGCKFVFVFLIFQVLLLDHKLVYVGNLWKSQGLGEGAAEASESQHSHRPGREQGRPRREETRGARGESSDSCWGWFILILWNCTPTVIRHGNICEQIGFINVVNNKRASDSALLSQQSNDRFLSLIWILFQHLCLIKKWAFLWRMYLFSCKRTPRPMLKTLACFSWRRRPRRPSMSTSSFWPLVRIMLLDYSHLKTPATHLLEHIDHLSLRLYWH